MMLRRLSSREKTMALVCLTAVAVYAVYYFVIKPMKEEIDKSEKQIAIAEKRLTKNLSVTRQMKTVDEEYEKYKAPLKQKASDEQEMASILSEIESAAGQLDIRVADMKPKKVKRISFYNQFSVSLTIDGQLETITHFLYILQNSPHFLGVDEIRFEKTTIRSSQVKCSIVLSKSLIP